MESDACTTENLPSHSCPCLYPGGNEASMEGKPWGQQVTMDQAASGCSCSPPDPCWLHGQILWKETPAWGNEPTLLGLHMKWHSIHRKPPTYRSPLGSRLLDKYHASPSKRRPLLFNLLENSTANIALPLPPMKFFPLCVPLCNYEISPMLVYILSARAHFIPYADLNLRASKCIVLTHPDLYLLPRLLFIMPTRMSPSWGQGFGIVPRGNTSTQQALG